MSLREPPFAPRKVGEEVPKPDTGRFSVVGDPNDPATWELLIDVLARVPLKAVLKEMPVPVLYGLRDAIDRELGTRADAKR
jgi:hypothetical protein